MTVNVPARSPYQGVAQIFKYNRPFYLWTAASTVAAIVVSLYVPPELRILILAATGCAVFWICSSLAVSHYVYDRSGLYRLGWLPGCLSRTPKRWINIHAGIDENSVAIWEMFPGSEGDIIDIYDPSEMTEPSIKRARRIAGVVALSRERQRLPDEGEEFDAAFLIFSAHELRRHEGRVRLLRQLAPVLRAEGEVVLVEHLRDWANFLAFGPGFLHFFSARTWQRAAKAADMPIRLQRGITPFVRVFVLQKQQ